MPKILAVDHKLNWIFYCPGCGCHHGISTNPPRPVWTWNGSVDKPTFSPSLLVKTGPKADPITHLAPGQVCHSFIKDGMIQFLGDCMEDFIKEVGEMKPCGFIVECNVAKN